jgi:hypothetical protein
MQSGELIVTGTDQVTIDLNDFPSEVKVHFKDEAQIVPCNPHHLDTLEFEVQTTVSGFVLLVKWSVTNVREIKWHVAY